MKIMKPSNQVKKLKEIGQEILQELEHVSKKLIVEYPTNSDEFSRLSYELHMRQLKMAQKQRSVKNEPFVGYCDTKQGEKFFFCRNFTPHRLTPTSDSIRYVSYKSPMGAMIANDVSDFSVQTPSGLREFFITAKDVFRSQKNRKWDAVLNNVEMEDFIQAIPSYRSWLDSKSTISPEPHSNHEGDRTTNHPSAHNREQAEVLNSELGKYKNEIHMVTNPKEIQDNDLGVTPHRNIISHFELRDQPVLDKNQDAIFRLPLQSQVILSGAPGTGKTTVLIKRISQKTKLDFLTDEEKNHLDLQKYEEEVGQDRGWVIYTPNELLRNYLKESLNKELLSATDMTVKAWNHEKINIARDTLKILKVRSSGSFGLSKVNHTKIDSNKDLMIYAKDFISYFSKEATLSSTNFFKSMDMCINAMQYAYSNIENTSSNLKDNRQADWSGKALKLYNQSSDFIKPYLSVNKNQKHEIITFINTLCLRVTEGALRKKKKGKDKLMPQKRKEIEVIKGHCFRLALDVLSLHILDDPLQSKNNIRSLINDLTDLQDLETEYFTKKLQEIETQLQIVNITNDRKIVKACLCIIMALNALIAIWDSHKGFRELSKFTCRIFKDFRIKCQKQAKYYSSDVNFEENHIDSVELDVLIHTLLYILRKSYIKLSRTTSKDAIHMPDNIKGLSNKFRQITAIDEVTDFSSLDVGSIFFLTSPETKSLTLSGDLMQRVNPLGISNWEELNFVPIQFSTYQLDLVYRLNAKLLKIASTLYESFVGTPSNFKSPYNTSNDPAPSMYKGKTFNDECMWIAERVYDIYTAYNDKLPSIAIFVSNETLVDETFKVIEPILFENSIETEACFQGRVLGVQSKVRIFSVEFIKGLEFESVFFADISQMSFEHCSIIDNLLYVGLTRASNFLGVSYHGAKPNILNKIESHFYSWN